MIPEAPVLFSIAGISASLAGLAGLVAGLRRGADVRPMDLFRLREIVEFAFANVLLALSTIPIALAIGSEGDGFRIVAIGAMANLLVHMGVLYERSRRSALPTTRGWVIGVVAVNIVALLLGSATVATGSLAAFEGLLLALLARPMLAFLLVFASFQSQ